MKYSANKFCQLKFIYGDKKAIRTVGGKTTILKSLEFDNSSIRSVHLILTDFPLLYTHFKCMREHEQLWEMNGSEVILDQNFVNNIKKVFGMPMHLP